LSIDVLLMCLWVIILMCLWVMIVGGVVRVVV